MTSPQVMFICIYVSFSLTVSIRLLFKVQSQQKLDPKSAANVSKGSQFELDVAQFLRVSKNKNIKNIQFWTRSQYVPNLPTKHTEFGILVKSLHGLAHTWLFTSYYDKAVILLSVA